MRFVRGFSAPTLLALACASSPAADLFVATTGRDTNPGTENAPFASLSAARDAARKLAGKETVTVNVGDGVYYLPETFVLSPADSGSAAFPIVYRASHEGRAVLSGGLKLELAWKPFRDGILQAEVPAGLVLDQLFVNGQRQRMARYPNFDPEKTTAAYQGYAADAFSKERAARWADPAGGFIHAMHGSRWGGYHYRITGKKPDGSVAYEGGWQNNRQMGMHKELRMVENIFEELDAPGEWFHQAKTNTLFFMPPPGTDLAKATVEVVRLRHLVEFQGSQAAPVRHISLQGFVFRHTARTFMDTKEPLLRSDWTIYRGGAVLITGTEDVSVLDSEFDQPGGNAVFVNLYNRRVRVKGCHIHDAGASGVCFVGDPKAVRDPLFEYGQRQDLAKIDRTPGPKTDNYPADCAVEDSLIHGIGRVERQPAGVQISMAQGIAVRDTSIYDCARSGLNISEGTWGGHLIERCDVFDTVLETHDHGSFNSWGRDRYWVSDHRGVSQPAVAKDQKLPFLDAVKPTTIRDSRWRCDHGWDIDLDDGSSNYEIYNNLLLHGGLKFREGYGRKAWNNIMVNNGFHPHVWFENSGDEFTRNIVMRAHADIGMPSGWGKGVDQNLFSSERDRKAKAQAGCDANSASGDPQFVDAAQGDFRVKETSPALKVGFKNFPMDQFGVKKPALKALAKTPEIPAVSFGNETTSASSAPAFVWLGARLHGLAGEEFSAFGTAKEDGGVQLVTEPFAGLGLKKDDLVQGLNGRKIRTVEDLLTAVAALRDEPLSARIVRHQKEQTVAVNAPFVAAESAREASGFTRLRPGAPTAAKITARPRTSNEPLTTLLDGKLARSYGPVFPNGVPDGAYKLDLGSARAITALTSWSHNEGGVRGRQLVTLYGSASASDPGWKLDDPIRFTPLGTIDTGAPAAPFQAASLRARAAQTLGTFRWIVWSTAPLNATGENTAFQELAVETKP